jgi:hypothetical protein
MSELEDSIERNLHPLEKEHSDFFGAIEDLPTPPVGHPSVRVASAFAEEGIFRREIMLLGFILVDER